MSFINQTCMYILGSHPSYPQLTVDPILFPCPGAVDHRRGYSPQQTVQTGNNLDTSNVLYIQFSHLSTCFPANNER